MLVLVPSAGIQKLRSIIDIMDTNAKQIVADKVAAVQRGDVAIEEGKDILSRLGEWNPWFRSVL